MRNIRICSHISLDGVIAPAPRREADDDYVHGGWTSPFRSPEGRDAVVEAQGAHFDLLLGRRTYDLWSGYWPKAASSPIADRLNAATKHVATHRPDTLEWGPAEPLGTDIPTAVRRLKSAPGPDLIVWGSSTLTSVLLQHGLADEVVLIVYPVLLGRGIRFFSDDADPRQLALVNTKSTSSGVMFNAYRCVSP